MSERTRREILKRQGAIAAVGVTGVSATTAQGSPPDGSGGVLDERRRPDVRVVNNGTEQAAVVVRLRRQGRSGPVFSQEFTVPGLNAAALADLPVSEQASRATETIDRFDELDAGMYVIEVRAGSQTQENELEIGEYGLEPSLTVEAIITPAGELDLGAVYTCPE